MVDKKNLTVMGVADLKKKKLGVPNIYELYIKRFQRVYNIVNWCIVTRRMLVQI